MYTDYYGFSAKPFQLSPDPQFFFASSGHRRALAYLRYGLSQGEGFIVITGGIGTGKTTLAKSLFNELDTTALVAAQLVTTQLEADDLLRMVVAAFSLPYENLPKAALIKHLENFLKGCAAAGKRVLLIIDEAQNLPPRSLEELRMLSNFQVSDAPLLQSFLLGQAEFRDTLQTAGMEQLRQRVIASCHLNPLTEQETREYIEHRLRLVGWQNTPYFASQAYAAIHDYTQGVPRRINIFCDRLLLYGFLEELQQFSEAAVAAVSRELGHEQARPAAVATTADVANSLVQPPTEGEAVRRMTELERSMAVMQRALFTVSKTMDSDARAQKERLDRLEKRLAELEASVREFRWYAWNSTGPVKR